jgi:hypothetical protein
MPSIALMKPLLFACFVLVLFSCKKETFIRDANAQLSTSADTLHFDTVFTSTGSVTKFFRIYNNNDQKLLLSEVSLAGGNSSAFKINVNGVANNSTDIEIAANDSIYVFVSVKIIPGQEDRPFVIEDSIRISYNGNNRFVQLQAWGQNAHFMRSRVISANETWLNDKPYVILGGLQVDTNVTLSIEKGCRIYVHANAPVLVDGTLKANGEKYDSTRIIFQGDRLDEPYKNYPGSWPGIYFRDESKDNVLTYTNIRNAYQGLVAEKPSSNANPKLILREVIVDNCYDAGILALQSSITAENVLVSNCGKSVVLAFGGRYDFNHCTVVAYSNNFITHKDPLLQLTNSLSDGTTVLTSDLRASFSNCIFWADQGTVENEVVVYKQGNTVFDASFRNCLWRVKTEPQNITPSDIISNKDPMFDSVNVERQFYNFQLKQGSPAIARGITTPLTIDLNGNPRKTPKPDIGAYETQ